MQGPSLGLLRFSNHRPGEIVTGHSIEAHIPKVHRSALGIETLHFIPQRLIAPDPAFDVNVKLRHLDKMPDEFLIPSSF